MTRVRVLVKPEKRGNSATITYLPARRVFGQLQTGSGAQYLEDWWDLNSEYPYAYVEVECFRDEVNGPVLSTPEPADAQILALTARDNLSTNEWRLLGEEQNAWDRFTHGNLDNLYFSWYSAGLLTLSNGVWSACLQTIMRKDGGDPTGSRRSGPEVWLDFVRVKLNPNP